MLSFSLNIKAFLIFSCELPTILISNQNIVMFTIKCSLCKECIFDVTHLYFFVVRNFSFLHSLELVYNLDSHFSKISIKRKKKLNACDAVSQLLVSFLLLLCFSSTHGMNMLKAKWVNPVVDCLNSSKWGQITLIMRLAYILATARLLGFLTS